MNFLLFPNFLFVFLPRKFNHILCSFLLPRLHSLLLSLAIQFQPLNPLIYISSFSPSPSTFSLIFLSFPSFSLSLCFLSYSYFICSLSLFPPLKSQSNYLPLFSLYLCVEIKIFARFEF